MRIVYPVWSLQRPRDSSRNPHIAAVRDGGAHTDLLGSLWRMGGFEYGEPIFSYSTRAPGQPDAGADHGEGLAHVDISFVRPGGLLLHTTRPSVNEHIEAPRKANPPARSDLEVRIWSAWTPFFDLCARSRVRTAAEIARLLPPELRSRRDVKFRQNSGSSYKELWNGRGWRRPDGPNLTAAWLLYLDELPGGGPGLINPFGMDAVVTLAWCYRLGRDFAHLLREPGFTMVEIETTPVPEEAGIPDWTGDWNIRTLVRVTL